MVVKNLFNKLRKDRVTTIEASKYKDDKMVAPDFRGIHTIKNVNAATSDDLFAFHIGVNIIPGYLETSNAKTLNLIDGKNKIIKSICNSFYHSILDDMSEIIYTSNLYPDHDIIIDISDIEKSLFAEGSQWDFFNFFVEAMKLRKIKVSLVTLKKYDVIYIDNFKLVAFIYESGKKTNLVYELFKERVSNPNIIPFKDVFVSRGKMGDPPEHNVEGLSFNKDSRMDDHIALEDYFASMGYEIIHAEMFNSFQEQLDYFYSAKTIASITGSGLTNAAFMQPGGTMFEIVTPLVVAVPPPDQPKDITKPFFVQEIHNFYKNVAYYQNHTFACVQNPNRSIKEFKETIESNPKLKAFLDRNE
jgi:hypothetical protein